MHRISVLLVIFGSISGLQAQIDTKPLIAGVGVDQHLGDTINMDLMFKTHKGDLVRLGDLLDSKIPTVIAPVYYSCPQLCTLVLNGVRDLMNDTNLVLGRDYQVINVSFDPENTPELAAEKAVNYYATLNNKEAVPQHWQFLSGSQEMISPLMEDIGFRYKKVNGDYSHTSVIVLLSPEGMITRYFGGVSYDAGSFRKAVVEASKGTVGTPLEAIWTYCFRYDPLAGKYVPQAWRIMRVGALFTLILLAAFLSFLWSKEITKKRRLGPNV